MYHTSVLGQNVPYLVIVLHIWPYWTLCHNNEYYVLLESLQSLQGDGSLQPPQQWQETNFIQRVQVDTSHELEEGRPFLTSSAEKAVKLLVWLHSGLSPDWHTVNCAIVPLWDPLFHIVVSCESPRFYCAAFTVAPQLLLCGHCEKPRLHPWPLADKQPMARVEPSPGGKLNIEATMLEPFYGTALFLIITTVQASIYN